MNQTTPNTDISEDALARAEQALQIEQDKRIQDARVKAGIGTEPDPVEPRKPETDPAV